MSHSRMPYKYIHSPGGTTFWFFPFSPSYVGIPSLSYHYIYTYSAIAVWIGHAAKKLWSGKAVPRASKRTKKAEGGNRKVPKPSRAVEKGKWDAGQATEGRWCSPSNNAFITIIFSPLSDPT